MEAIRMVRTLVANQSRAERPLRVRSPPLPLKGSDGPLGCMYNIPKAKTTEALDGCKRVGSSPIAV